MKLKHPRRNRQGIVPFEAWRESVDLSETTAWRMREAGFIVVIKIGRRVFISRREIARFERRAVAGEFVPGAASPLRTCAVPSAGRSRVGVGVCPSCNRTLQSVARQMKTKHADHANPQTTV